MTFAEIETMLESIPGMTDKVAYRAFPEKEAPALPFICYEENNTDNFMADNGVFKEVTSFDINLYEEFRDLTTEHALEAMLNEKEIPWNRYPEWIDDERMWEVTYEVEV